MSATALPAVSAPRISYGLEGSLEWVPSSAPDRLNLSGSAIQALFEVEPIQISARYDANGFYLQYAGTATLQIGAASIPLASSSVTFFDNANKAGSDLFNLLLNPAGGDPTFYSATVNLPSWAN